MKIENITTDLGNEILETLLKGGWKKSKEYSPLAFDKGIDYDSYTFTKNDQTLEFEWTNWFEWEITGTTAAVNNLAVQYSLKPLK